MNLKTFKELIKDLPDDVEIIIDARSNPFGNCWSVLTIEMTSISSFGISSPAIRLSEDTPNWCEEQDDSPIYIHPKYGTWFHAKSNKG